MNATKSSKIQPFVVAQSSNLGLSFKLREEYLVYGYIQQKCSQLLKEAIPTDIIKLCLLFYQRDFEILKFSSKYKSKEGITLSDDNKCVTRIKCGDVYSADGHKYCLVEDTPAFNGLHCWRVHVDNQAKGFNWIMFGISEFKEHDDYSYKEGNLLF